MTHGSKCYRSPRMLEVLTERPPGNLQGRVVVGRAAVTEVTVRLASASSLQWAEHHLRYRSTGCELSIRMGIRFPDGAICLCLCWGKELSRIGQVREKGEEMLIEGGPKGTPPGLVNQKGWPGQKRRGWVWTWTNYNLQLWIYLTVYLCIVTVTS